MVMLNPTPVKGSKMGMFGQNSIDFLMVCQWLPVGGRFCDDFSLNVKLPFGQLIIGS
ncbi:hypothetical protein [Vibrio sp. S12_S33]|uniref:hypothetical protein n=1 Tax=Vibrio sp. S12_S33 TaxID=2720223 RepID=UPI00177C99A6|nr:hypothetical protein [Vibrio sp. S12_S33]MBD1564729.1 hypothetical protein [Vibrio sp. S12_S33]